MLRHFICLYSDTESDDEFISAFETEIYCRPVVSPFVNEGFMIIGLTVSKPCIISKSKVLEMKLKDV